jgi:hypothetical protein
MAATFDFLVTPMSESIHTTSVVLLGPENVGVAVGILVLSYMQAEIYVTAYVLPVNGGHVWFTSHYDVREYPTMSNFVAVPHKYWYPPKFGHITLDL